MAAEADAADFDIVVVGGGGVEACPAHTQSRAPTRSCVWRSSSGSQCLVGKRAPSLRE